MHDKGDLAGEAALREAPDVLQDLVDVDRPAFDRPMVGELFHAVDQGADPVGLVADQPDQRMLVGAHALLEQLGGAADPGQGVLDLVGQRRAKAGDREAGAAPVGQLVVEAMRDRAGMQHDQAVARALGERRHVQVDQTADAPVQRQLDAVVGDDVAGQLDPTDQIEQRAVVRHQVGERPVLEHGPAGPEQLLRGGIDEHDPECAIERQNAAGHGVQDHALQQRHRRDLGDSAHPVVRPAGDPARGLAHAISVTNP